MSEKNPLEGLPFLSAASNAASKNKGAAILGLVIAGGLGFYIFNKFFKAQQAVFEKVGLADDANEKKLKAFKSSVTYKTAFQPNYHNKKGKSHYGVSSNRINQLADIINDSLGFWNDDEKKFTGVFSAISKKIDVSRLADAYIKRHQEDLYLTLENSLSSEEMANVIRIVENMNS